MKKILLSSILALGLSINLNAYEINGDLGVKWTGFKTEKKAPVSGTFKDIKLSIQNNSDLNKFLTSAKVEIQTASFDSKNPFRDKNITSTLFSLVSSKVIKGTIKSVNENNKSLVLNVTMNEVKKEVPMTYNIKDGEIIAKGSIEILDYDMKNPFIAFAQKCASFHANKSFSDVNIEFTIPFK